MVIATTKSVIFVTIVVLVEVSFQPLAELKVIQVARLDQLCNIDVTLDTVLVESLLEDLVVLDEFVFVLCIPLDSFVREGAWVE